MTSVAAVGWIRIEFNEYEAAPKCGHGLHSTAVLLVDLRDARSIARAELFCGGPEVVRSRGLVRSGPKAPGRMRSARFSERYRIREGFAA